MRKTKTIDEIKREFKEKHGKKYNYDLVEYNGNNKKVSILCFIHGEFTQTPASHKRGSGCPKCGRIKCNKTSMKTRDEIINRFSDKHGNRYDYSLVEYNGTKVNVRIICEKHGIFLQRPDNHLAGKGCKNCQTEKTAKEIYTNRKTILYYIKINDLYKIGITVYDERYKDVENNVIEGRYRRNKKDNIFIEFISGIVYEDGYEAYKKEQQILNDYKEYKYTNEDMRWFGGYSELFSFNIMKSVRNLSKL